mmetsp:Transcript_68372/g.142530  ORF Transcript_68372/g.142530 Transcript_68372/m.142530 type:complete len:212 (+) Transcript_68372:170-805(+)
MGGVLEARVEGLCCPGAGGEYPANPRFCSFSTRSSSALLSIASCASRSFLTSSPPLPLDPTLASTALKLPCPSFSFCGAFPSLSPPSSDDCPTCSGAEEEAEAEVWRAGEVEGTTWREPMPSSASVKGIRSGPMGMLVRGERLLFSESHLLMAQRSYTLLSPALTGSRIVSNVSMHSPQSFCCCFAFRTTPFFSSDGSTSRVPAITPLLSG